MPNTYLQCTLDESSNQLLQDWYAELRGVEAAVVTQEAVLTATLTDFLATDKVCASLTIGILGTNSVTITAKEGGTDAHRYAFSFRSDTGDQALTLTVYGGTLFVVTLATDVDGFPLSLPSEVAALLTANAQFSAAMTAVGAGTFAAPPCTVQYLSGGKNAPLVSTEKALQLVFNGAGITYQQALTQIDIPTVQATPAATLAQISDALVLVSSKVLRVSGTNLVALRALWLQLESATDTLVDHLPGDDGTPLIVWTITTSVTTTIPDCDGGGTQTTTVTHLDTVDEKPSTSTATPTVWWRTNVGATTENITRLYTLGLSQDQVNVALAATTDYIIEDSAITTTLSCTSTDLDELLALTVEGVVTSSYSAEIGALPPTSPAKGLLSPAWTIPGGAALLADLSPITALRSEIQAMTSSGCIDLVTKGQFATLIAMIEAPISMATRVIERVREVVHPVIERISSVVSSVQQILDKVPKSSCLLGDSLGFETPSIDLLKIQLTWFTLDVKGVIDDIQGTMIQVQPPLCKIETAITRLIGPTDPDTACLTKGLTNLLLAQIGNLKYSLPLPCVNNPFDALRVFEDIQDKVSSLVGLVNSLLADLLTIQAQVNFLMDSATSGSNETSSGTACESVTLSTLLKRIKSRFA